MESFITLHQIWLHSQSTPNNFPLLRVKIFEDNFKKFFLVQTYLQKHQKMSKEPKKFHPSDGGIVSQPIWKQSHLQKVVVSGKIMGRKTLLEKIKFSSVFRESDLWAPVKCCWRDVLSGVMGYERMLLWRKFPINCVHPTHRKCKIFFENTNFYPFLCILPFIVCFQTIKASKVTIILDI